MNYTRLALVGFVIRKRDTEYKRLVGVADVISARFIDLGNINVVDIPTDEFIKAFNLFNLSEEFRDNIVKSNGGYIIKAMGYLLIAGDADLSCVNISKDNYNECYNINVSLFDEDDNLVNTYYFNGDKEYGYSGYVFNLNLDDVYFKVDTIALNVEYSFEPFDLDKDNLIKLQTCNEFCGFEPSYLSRNMDEYAVIRGDFESISSVVTNNILSIPDCVSKLSIGKRAYIKDIITLEIGNPNLEIMACESIEENVKFISGDSRIKEKNLDIGYNLSKITVPREVNADRVKKIVLGLYGISIRSLHKYKGDNTKLNNLKLADTKEEVISIIKSDFGIDIVEV